MITISKSQVIAIHSRLIEETGGIDGVRDEAMLESALNTPFHSFDGKDVYATIVAKAARLCFGLVKNHAFVDGNKRIGAHVLLVFLALNGIDLSYTQEELSDTILAVASNELDFNGLLNWVLEHQL